MASRSVRKLAEAEGGAESDDAKEAGDEIVAEWSSVDKFEEFGMNASDIKKLKEAGFCTVGSVQMACMKDLLNVRGISEAKVEKLREACKKLVPSGFRSATEVAHARAGLMRLTTGCKEVDEIIGGGIEARAITEIFGEFRTGKTQMCITLAVTAQLPKELSARGPLALHHTRLAVLWIDTEGTFRPERVREVAEKRFEISGDQVLDNILVARAYTHEQQMQFVTDATAALIEDSAPYALLVIDSVMALFRVDFVGRGELAERQQKLNKHLNQIKKLAEEFNLAVVLTNQVTADPGASAAFVADAKKPVGGHILAHASTTRLYMRKGSGNNRICKVFDSPNMPEAEATFGLSEGGCGAAE